MKSDMQDLRYRIGDLLGDYAPESFRRRSSSSEWIIGLGSIVAAVGISYLAMRMADRRLGDVMRRILPMREGREHESVQDGEPGRMHEPASADMFSPRGRDSRARTGETETAERIGQPSGNRH